MMGWLTKGGKGSGNWGHAGRKNKRGGSAPAKPGVLQRLPPEKRVWQRKREEGRSPHSKDERTVFGAKGERVVAKALAQLFKSEFRLMNDNPGGNCPVDLIGENGLLVEVKSGKTTNVPGARQWRVTAGEPSLREKVMMIGMPEDMKRKLNFERLCYLMMRKHGLAYELDRETGKDHEPVTVGVIFSADEKRADLYMVPGFHLRLGWGTYATDKYYLGTVQVDD